MGNSSLWVDMETTGLEAGSCIPLELGFRLTDPLGYTANMEADTFTTLLWEPGQRWSIKMMEGAAHKIVGPMHEKSGLWDDLLENRSKNTMSVEQADRAAVAWLEGHGFKSGELPLWGQSIGSLDRPFILEHFPKLNAFLHYRNVDISTLKVLCQTLNPELFEKLPDKVEGHRVQDDIAASIAEYRWYVDEFLIVSDLLF